MIRCFVIVCLFSVLWGCQDVDDALKSDSGKRVGAPGGLATAGDIDDVQQAASGAPLAGPPAGSTRTPPPQVASFETILASSLTLTVSGVGSAD